VADHFQGGEFIPHRMKPEEIKPVKNGWLPIAALELKAIQTRWHDHYSINLTYRKLEETLMMSGHTLRKLNPAHLDYSFSLQSLDTVYQRFVVILPLYLNPEELEEERQWLADSRQRVLMHIAPLPPRMLKLLDEEGYRVSGGI